MGSTLFKLKYVVQNLMEIQNMQRFFEFQGQFKGHYIQTTKSHDFHLKQLCTPFSEVHSSLRRRNILICLIFQDYQSDQVNHMGILFHQIRSMQFAEIEDLVSI